MKSDKLLKPFGDFIVFSCEFLTTELRKHNDNRIILFGICCLIVYRYGSSGSFMLRKKFQRLGIAPFASCTSEHIHLVSPLLLLSVGVDHLWIYRGGLNFYPHWNSRRRSCSEEGWQNSDSGFRFVTHENPPKKNASVDGRVLLTHGYGLRGAVDMNNHDHGALLGQVLQRPQQRAPPVLLVDGHENLVYRRRAARREHSSGETLHLRRSWHGDGWAGGRAGTPAPPALW